LKPSLYINKVLLVDELKHSLYINKVILVDDPY